MKTIVKDISLSDQQNRALCEILEWFHNSDKRQFVLAGYAGSGKSTLARFLAQEINCHFAAYTGKAAHVLREKGVDGATTIHGFLYNYIGKDENDDPVFAVTQENLFGKFLLVIDEYSMLDQTVIDDVLSKCNKVLFLGDPMQLPPIKEGRQILKPDFFLDEIHRQALDSPIVKWAHEIRNGNIPKIGTKDGGFEVISKRDKSRELFDSVDQVICGRNDTKRKINQAMREHYGFAEKSAFPVRGDKIMCLKNNHKENLYNGLLFSCARDSRNQNSHSYMMHYNGADYESWSPDMLETPNQRYDYKSRLERFCYAYGITCHKTQGSEFNSVFVYDESWGAQKINWLYTAVTRAREQCILAI